MRCPKCGGKILESGVCDVCGLMARRDETKEVPKVEFKEPSVPIKTPYIATIFCFLLNILAAFTPWINADYKGLLYAEGTVWQFHHIIGHTANLLTETSACLLIFANFLIILLSIIYIIKALLSKPYTERNRMGVLGDNILLITLGLMIACWFLNKISMKMTFKWGYYLEVFLLALNKFGFMRMYNRKFYFMKKAEEAEKE